MQLLVAPDSFKGTLSAAGACAAIAEGLRRALPNAELAQVPLADGGEGTAEAIVAATHGEWRTERVSGPLGAPLSARFGLLNRGNAAIVEMAAASGLMLIPAECRDVLRASTFGTGELIRAALASGVTHVLVAIGGSATCDGGSGMAQALGVRFLDASGMPLPDGMAGGDLTRIHAIDMRGLLPAVRTATIDILCDVRNPLTGPHGAAHIYAPQKGASPEQVAMLDSGLARFADVIERDLGIHIDALPGAGAAGGLGAGLVAFLGGRLTPGAANVMRYVDFDSRAVAADAIITGEGRLDAQSLDGKVVSAVAAAGHRLHRPVFVIAGQVDLPPSAQSPFAGVASVDESGKNVAADPAGRLVARTERAARDWFARE